MNNKTIKLALLGIAAFVFFGSMTYLIFSIQATSTSITKWDAETRKLFSLLLFVYMIIFSIAVIGKSED